MAETRRQSRDHDDSNRLRGWCRPGENGPRRQTKPTGRQRHGRELLLQRTCRQATRVAARADPQATVIAVLMNPNFPDAGGAIESPARSGAHTRVTDLHFSTPVVDNEIDDRFATLAQQRADALIVAADPFFTSRRNRIIALTAQHAVPAIYDLRDWAVSGGLISYGTDVADAFRQTGIYTGKILKGTRPTDLPVMQSTKYELVINLKSAKTARSDHSAVCCSRGLMR